MNTVTTTTFCLFDGRHELPANSGAIFSSFDFSTNRGVRTIDFEKLIGLLDNNNSVDLIVTGLTPALVEILIEVTQRVTLGIMEEPLAEFNLLHYNPNTKDYWKQRIPLKMDHGNFYAEFYPAWND